MKRTLWVLFVLVFGFALRAEECLTTAAEAGVETAAAAAFLAGATPGEAATLKDGNALLGSLLTLFDNLIVEKKGSPGEEKAAKGEEKVTKGGLALVEERISQLAVEANNALDAGLIDKIFFHRYERMLTIYKLVVTPVVRGDVLKEVFQRVLDDFVWNVAYEHWAWGDKDGIAKMAAAMEEEFVQLHFYLDTKLKREELKKKIGRRMLPPPPPPPGAKKKAEEAKPE